MPASNRSAGKGRPEPPEGARSIIREGIQLIAEDPDFETVEDTRGTLGTLRLGHVYESDGDPDAVSVRRTGAFNPSGVGRMEGTRFSRIVRAGGAARPSAASGRPGPGVGTPVSPSPSEGQETALWAVHVHTDPPAAGILAGRVRPLGDGIHAGVLGDQGGGDGVLEALAPGVAVGLLPLSPDGEYSPDAMVYGQVQSAFRLPDGRLSLMLAAF